MVLDNRGGAVVEDKIDKSHIYKYLKIYINYYRIIFLS